MIIVEAPEFLAFTLKSDRNPAPGSVKGVFTAAPIRSLIQRLQYRIQAATLQKLKRPRARAKSFLIEALGFDHGT